MADRRLFRDQTAARVAILEGLGYQVAFREDGFVSCAIWGPDRWHGVGPTKATALSDALSKMFPSRAAARMLSGHVDALEADQAAPPLGPDEDVRIDGAAGTPTPEPAAATTYDGSAPATHSAANGHVVEAHVDDVPPVAATLPAERTGDPEPLVVADEPAQAAAEPAPQAASTPATATAAAMRVDDARREAERRAADEQRRKALREEAKARLAALRGTIDDQRDGVCRAAPDLLRAQLHAWICSARAEEEASGGDPYVAKGVHDIARTLSEIAKRTWPGSVNALMKDSMPEDATAGHARSWRDAAAAATADLAALRASFKRARCDDLGYVDATTRGTSRAAADDALDELETVLATIGGPLDGRYDAPRGDVDVRPLVAAAIRLRSFRLVVEDGARWGTAMGRLRRLSRDLGPAARVLRDAIDPSSAPGAESTSRVAGGEPVAQGDDAEADALAALASLLDDAPSADDSHDVVLAWIAQAVDHLPTTELAANLAAVAPTVAAIDVAAIADRRIRRRVRDVQGALNGAHARGAPSSDEDAAADDAPAHARHAALAALRAEVRAHTNGKRALFVSNRPDPQLARAIEDTLGVDVSWCESTPRRIDAERERIAQHRYDIVLAATGFLDHTHANEIARAAKNADVLHVRVDRGRPLACVLAIARDLGINARP